MPGPLDLTTKIYMDRESGMFFLRSVLVAVLFGSQSIFVAAQVGKSSQPTLLEALSAMRQIYENQPRCDVPIGEGGYRTLAPVSVKANSKFLFF